MSHCAEQNLGVRLIYLAIATGYWLIDSIAGLWRGARRQVVVLCYHGVTARQQKAFAWQMAQLPGRGVDVADGAAGDGRSGRRPSVCVTFDDAFANLLDNALPIMHESKIPAIVFAVPANLGDRPGWEMPAGHPEAAERVMTAEQLLTAARQGLCRIGSHTMTHKPLGRCEAATVVRECRESKAALETLLGVPVEDLALPYGSYNAPVIRTALAAGYTRIYTVEPILHAAGIAGTIGRFSMSPDIWRIEFLLTCAGAYQWLHPWRRFLRRLRSWRASPTTKEPSFA